MYDSSELQSFITHKMQFFTTSLRSDLLHNERLREKEGGEEKLYFH